MNGRLRVLLHGAQSHEAYPDLERQELGPVVRPALREDPKPQVARQLLQVRGGQPGALLKRLEQRDPLVRHWLQRWPRRARADGEGDHPVAAQGHRGVAVL